MLLHYIKFPSNNIYKQITLRLFMPKKRVKKSATRKKSTTKNKTATKKPERLENKILQNLVELQKVHTNLANKFEQLSDQISELLALFEMSARSFAKQPHIQVAEKDKEFLDKIDKLLEQNKTIARGLTLMEGKMREKLYGSGPERIDRLPPRQPPRYWWTRNKESDTLFYKVLLKN